MDTIGLIFSLIGIALSAYFLIDKSRSFGLLRRRERNYASILRFRNKLREEFIVEKTLKSGERVTRRIIIKDSDIDNIDNVRNAYIWMTKKDFKIKSEHLDVKFTTEAYLDSIKEVKYIYNNTLSIGKTERFKYITSAGLIGSVLNNYVSAIDKASIDRNTIVGIMVGNKISKDTKAYGLLFASLLVYLLTGLFSSIDLSYEGASIFLILIGGLALNQKMLELRIKNGLYGTNPYEAKEIIKFIEEHSDKSDFTDGGKTKKLIQDAEESSREEIVWGGAYQQ